MYFFFFFEIYVNETGCTYVFKLILWVFDYFNLICSLVTMFNSSNVIYLLYEFTQCICKRLTTFVGVDTMYLWEINYFRRNLPFPILTYTLLPNLPNSDLTLIVIASNSGKTVWIQLRWARLRVIEIQARWFKKVFSFSFLTPKYYLKKKRLSFSYDIYSNLVIKKNVAKTQAYSFSSSK